MEIIQNNNNGENTSNGCNNTEFPEGMRVLAVDDNSVCLKLLTALLKKCRYQVTSLSNKTEALELLKQNADNFDIVLTNVYIDEMEGFKLLEAGQELNIPVIMISASESRDIILKGVRYGAVDYLIKPIRLEVVKTIWQHVYRKKLACSRSTPLVNDDTTPPINNDHTEEVRDGLNRTSDHKEEVRDDQNRKSVENDGIEEIQSDQETSKDSRKSCKKERMKWTKELKEKFIGIVELLGGIDRAQPKKILELIDEPDITREQIASHLQKVRINWKEKQNNEQSSNHNKQNNDIHQYHNPLDFTSMAASSSHQQPILGNTMSQGGLSWLNYQRQLNYNYWQMIPSIGYTTPIQGRPSESILQQRRMLSSGGNFMGSSSSKPIESTLQQPNMMSFMGSSSSKPIESTLQQPNMMSFMGSSSSKPIASTLQQPNMMSFMGSSSSKPIASTLQQPNMMSFMGSSSSKPIASTLQQPNMMSNGGNFMSPSSSKPIESTLQQPNMMSKDGNFMSPSSSKPIEPTLQQPNMMSNDGNIMGSSSRCKPEKHHIPDDQRLQLQEVVSDRGPSTMDSTYEYLLNDILDSTNEYPTLFDFPEDEDYRNC